MERTKLAPAGFLLPPVTTNAAPNASPDSQATPRLLEVDLDEARLVQLRATFEKKMKNLRSKRKYTSVTVQLLYWEKIEETYLDSQREIEELKGVFEQRYNFRVLTKKLNDIQEKKISPQKLLQKCLSDLVYYHDEENSLLIVYYAGHGNPGSNGELILSGGNHSRRRQVDQVTWNASEKLIHTAEFADILLIFDCCFAGTLAGTLDRRALDSTIFEFLGSTAANGYARIPGKESFTTALIWALKALAEENEEDGFTTSQLYSKILKAPDFPSEEQTPTLSERRGHCSRRLMLAPLPSNEQPYTEISETGDVDEANKPLLSLNLQFLLPIDLSENDVEDMCDGLQNLVKYRELKATQIIWRGLSRKGPEMTASAVKAAYKWWGTTLQRKRTPSEGTGHHPLGKGKKGMPSPASVRSNENGSTNSVSSQETSTTSSPTSQVQDFRPVSHSRKRSGAGRPARRTKRRKDN